MLQLFNRIRLIGTKQLQSSVAIRQVVYLNMIWMFSYLAILINSIAAIFIYKSHYSFFLYSTIVVQFLLWMVFALIYFNKSTLAKRLFLVVIYATIAWYDYFYGKNSYTSLYFFAFMPSAFNIFSFKRNGGTMAFFIITPLVMVLFAEYYGYSHFSSTVWSQEITNSMRITNVLNAFMLFVAYAAYMILKSGYKQNKLITQSIALQTTLDNAVGAIWSIDSNYNIISVNKLFSEFIKREFGVDHVNIDTNLRTLMSKTPVPIYVKRHYIRVLSGESLFENFTYKDCDYELKATPILDEKNNEIVGATFTCRDVTSRVAAEKLLIEAKRKAEEASFAKERFLSNMSHELRTPLNGIVGVTNIMLDEQYLPEQERNFETLKNLSEHTLGVVNNILDLSKIDAEKAKLSNARFNLILFIKKLQSIFENTARLKKIDFGIEVSGNPDVFLKGDEIKLSQVLINLIGNSIKFTDKGFVKLMIIIDKDQDDSPHCKYPFFCIG